MRDYIRPAITQAAQAAGRPAPRVVCLLPVCVTDDPELARARAARVFAIYGQLPSYRAMLDREGAAGPEDVAIIGDEDTVGSKIMALADAGVTDFVANEFAQGGDAKRTRALLKSLIRRPPGRPGPAGWPPDQGQLRPQALCSSSRLGSFTRAPRPSAAASSFSAVSIPSQSA